MVRALLLALGALAAGADAQAPAWKFAKDQPPADYLVRLEHDEGKGEDKILLELTLRATLKSVSAEGDGTFELSWTDAKVTRTVGGKKHVYDSSKPAAAPSPASACFAELAGKTATATVSSAGELKSLEGALRRPGAGDFMSEGGDRDRMIGEALLGEVVVKLFRLPGGSSYAYGVICALGNAIGGCHLSDKTKMTRETPTKTPPGGGHVNRVWTSALESDGGSISAGGVTLKLTGGQVGTGKGSGVYGPGALVSLDDLVQYEMPTAVRTAPFKRALKIVRK